jgi:hypothetical protein
MKLCFVSVNGPRETCFVDEPRSLNLSGRFVLLSGGSTADPVSSSAHRKGGDQRPQEGKETSLVSEFEAG